MIRRPPRSTLFPLHDSLPIYGHTDDDGDEKYNQGLSERRAKSVMSYLVQHGVDAARLNAKGFGESQPIADRSEEHTSELQSRQYLVCRILLEKKKTTKENNNT